tara:strand:- start:50 stop:352 length:303 start_codon:yes stop_codon:yes gene_type:complete
MLPNFEEGFYTRCPKLEAWQKTVAPIAECPKKDAFIVVPTTTPKLKLCNRDIEVGICDKSWSVKIVATTKSFKNWMRGKSFPAYEMRLWKNTLESLMHTA